MLFMGEEFAASSPFLFFCDFSGDLARAVTEGRRAEFSRFARFADPAARERIPDPNAPATFARSKLDWSTRNRAPHADMLAFIQHLLALRREHLVPHLAQARGGRHAFEAPARIAVDWPLGADARLHLTANLDPHAVQASPLARGRVVYQSDAAGATLPPWFVRVSLDIGDG
jgi:maltooligosyltrehalose trehalohydrolase